MTYIVQIIYNQESRVKLLICSSYAIKPTEKKEKSVVTNAVDNRESIQLRKGKAIANQSPCYLCPERGPRSINDLLYNWQTLCKREAREVGLFRASP